MLLLFGDIEVCKKNGKKRASSAGFGRRGRRRKGKERRIETIEIKKLSKSPISRLLNRFIDK